MDTFLLCIFKCQELSQLKKKVANSRNMTVSRLFKVVPKCGMIWEPLDPLSDWTDSHLQPASVLVLSSIQNVNGKGKQWIQ